MSRQRRNEDEAVERLRELVQLFVRRFGLLLGDQTPCGQPLSTSHAHALMVLARAERPLRQNELGHSLGIDKSNVARLCAAMENKRHVEQLRSDEDGRSRLITLTDSGRRVAQSVNASSRLRFEELLAKVPKARRASMFEGLSALTEALVDSTVPSR